MAIANEKNLTSISKDSHLFFYEPNLVISKGNQFKRNNNYESNLIVRNCAVDHEKEKLKMSYLKTKYFQTKFCCN